MANFQIGHSALFPDGAELFANGKSGDEKLVLHAGNKIQLELAGMADSASPPVITADTASVPPLIAQGVVAVVVPVRVQVLVPVF